MGGGDFGVRVWNGVEGRCEGDDLVGLFWFSTNDTAIEMEVFLEFLVI